MHAPSPPITIRRATQSDVAGITACVCAAYLPWIPVIGRQPGPMLEDYAEVVVAHDVRVAVQGEAIVGVLVLASTGDGVFIDNVAVDPSVRGTGVGKKLLALAEGEARRRGFRSITLSTHEKMTSNREWYARNGYVDVERRPVSGYSRVFMRKALP
jgi:ribosomal protein S18 acetylase RimI-like enzyme